MLFLFSSLSPLFVALVVFHGSTHNPTHTHTHTHKDKRKKEKTKKGEGKPKKEEK
jgi:hypothetical protein